MSKALPKVYLVGGALMPNILTLFTAKAAPTIKGQHKEKQLRRKRVDKNIHCLTLKRSVSYPLSAVKCLWCRREIYFT